MAYVLAVEEQTLMAQLVAAGVESDPRDALDEVFAVKEWRQPGQERRPVKTRAPGVPDWWVDDADASASFLQAMGVHL